MTSKGQGLPPGRGWRQGRSTPGRRGCYHPRPPQTRTCSFPASGSSRESFAVAGMMLDIPSYRSSTHYACGHLLVEEHLASTAIHRRFVDRFAGLMSPPVFPADGSLHTAPPFPPSGPGKPSSPLLTGTMKALRLPICVSTVAYLFRFRRPRDPPDFVSAVALPEGRRPLPGPGFRL